MRRIVRRMRRKWLSSQSKRRRNSSRPPKLSRRSLSISRGSRRHLPIPSRATWPPQMSPGQSCSQSPSHPRGKWILSSRRSRCWTTTSKPNSSMNWRRTRPKNCSSFWRQSCDGMNQCKRNSRKSPKITSAMQPPSCETQPSARRL